jgi:hypothetical protein
MTKPGDETLTPVLSGAGGHVLRTAKGYRAFDNADQEIGIFQTLPGAVAAVMNGIIKD